MEVHKMAELPLLLLALVVGAMVAGVISYVLWLKRGKWKSPHAARAEIVADLYGRALELEAVFDSWAAAQEGAGDSKGFEEVARKAEELDAYHKANADRLEARTRAKVDAVVGAFKSRAFEVAFALENHPSEASRKKVDDVRREVAASVVERWLHEELRDALRELEKESVRVAGT